MENQKDNPATQAVTTRRPDGTWKEGVSGNPSGANGMKGLARWEVRMEHLAAKYPTMADLMQFFSVDKYFRLIPTDALMEVNPIDAGLLRQLAAMTMGAAKDARQDREAFWDRLQGTPTQTVNLRKVNPLDDIPTKHETVESAAAEFEEFMRANR